MPLLDWSLLALVTLIAAAAQGATGFGFAILVISFYLAILNSVAAVQLTIAVTLVISVVLAPRLWRDASRGLLGRLVVGTALGFPIGLLGYHYLSLDGVKIAVAVLIIAFAVYLLLSGLLSGSRAAAADGSVRTHGLADVGVGVLSGAMATALAMPGPAVILYLAAVGFGKDTSRATVLTLFAFSYAGALVLQATLVGIERPIWLAAAGLAPVAMVGALLGHLVARFLSEQVFRRAVLSILIVAGAYTLWSSLAA